jgi:hypothetical protein
MKCQNCNKVMDASRADAKFCSVACRVAAHRARAEHAASLKAAKPAAVDQEALVKARDEIERLQKKIQSMTEKTDKAAPSDNDQQRTIDRLKAGNKSLRQKMAATLAWHEDEMRRKGGMTFATMSKVMICLHSDKEPPTEAQRLEACKLFTQWKSDNAKARRL